MQPRLAFLLAAMLVPAAGESYDLEKALALPVTPGALALLVEHTSDPRVRAKLAEALKDTRAEVRGAAARVVTASSLEALVPNVIEALAVEKDGGIGIELVMAVAGFPDTEKAILDAAPRLDVASAAGRSLAGALGPRALDHLDMLREIDPKFPVSSFLRIASRDDWNSLALVAAKALRDPDPALWEAYLRAARASKQQVAAGPLSVAVSLEPLRSATLWHAVASRSPLSVPSELVMAGEDAFLIELLARQAGRKPKESEAWISARRTKADTPLTEIGEPESNDILLLLTKDERRALSDQVSGDSDGFDDWHKRARKTTEKEETPARPTVSVAEPRTVSDFPDGFVRSILEVTGCAPATSIGIGSAEVQFSPAGRPQKFLFHPQSAESESCEAASRALILNSVVGPAALSPKPEWSTLLVLLEPGFLECLSEPASTELSDLSGFSRDAFEPPNKLNEIHPAYPPSAREAKLPGSADLEAVITRSGCVRDLRTLRSTDTRFALAAIVATSRWRFDPARVEGKPISIVFSTTVNFTID